MASDQGKRRRDGIRERSGVYEVRVFAAASLLRCVGGTSTCTRRPGAAGWIRGGRRRRRAQGHQDPPDASHRARRRDNRAPHRAPRAMRRRPHGGRVRFDRRSFRSSPRTRHARSHATRTASPTVTGGWSRTSASTPTSTPYGTTAQLSCCPRESISGRWPDGSVMETARRHCASTPHRSARPISGPPR